MRREFLVAGIIAGLLVVPGTASAAVGDLSFEDCITTSEAVGPNPPGTGACDLHGESSAAGSNTGLHLPESVAVSPDGRSLYAVSGDDDAIARFDRDPATGELSFVFCFTGESETALTSCEGEAPEAAAGGADSGMDDPESVTVSPDGRSVYVTTRRDDSIVRFNRDPALGSIDYQGCISGDTGTGPGGSGACTQLPFAQPGGINSGFDDPKLKEVAITRDGESLYAASDIDASVVHFDRNPSTGALSYVGCLTGEVDSGPMPSGTGACGTIPSATDTFGGFGSGLGGPRWVALGPDDRSLYVASSFDDAVARFTRNPSSGALTYAACITGESEVAPPCTASPNATIGGGNSGFNNPRALEVSADGTSLYLAGASDSAVLRFARNPSTGGLTYTDCISGSQALGPSGSGACALTPGATAFGSASGLDQMRDLELSFDDQTLYTAAQGDDAVAWFDRDVLDGSLSFAACVSGNTNVTPCDLVPEASATGSASGVGGAETIGISADGLSAYANAEDDSAIARFAREPDDDPPNTRITKKPKKETTKRKAKFKFRANEPGSSFECKLDRKKFKPCESPFKKRVKVKKHKFKVRAIDTAGNVDPTPAKRKWRVVEDL
jgi:6-phosphogluconolactonase (cycloisomerase 2 family)